MYILDDEYEEHLKLLKNKLEHCLELNQKNAFVTMFWITKALMMKNYSKGLDWLSMVSKVSGYLSNVKDLFIFKVN